METFGKIGKIGKVHRCAPPHPYGYPTYLRRTDGQNGYAILPCVVSWQHIAPLVEVDDGDASWTAPSVETTGTTGTTETTGSSEAAFVA